MKLRTNDLCSKKYHKQFEMKFEQKSQNITTTNHSGTDYL